MSNFNTPPVSSIVNNRGLHAPISNATPPIRPMLSTFNPSITVLIHVQFLSLNCFRLDCLFKAELLVLLQWTWCSLQDAFLTKKLSLLLALFLLNRANRLEIGLLPVLRLVFPVFLPASRFLCFLTKKLSLLLALFLFLLNRANRLEVGLLPVLVSPVFLPASSFLRLLQSFLASLPLLQFHVGVRVSLLPPAVRLLQVLEFRGEVFETDATLRLDLVLAVGDEPGGHDQYHDDGHQEDVRDEEVVRACCK